MNFQKLTQQILESVDDNHREIYFNIISDGSMNNFMDEAMKLTGKVWLDLWDNSDHIDVYSSFEEGAAVLDITKSKIKIKRKK
jgi:regulator of sigma D